MAVLAGIGFVAACLLFLHLAMAAPQGAYLDLERAIMYGLRQPGTDVPAGPSWIPEAIRDITALGSAMVIILLTLVIIGYLLLMRRFTTVVLLIVATAGGQAVNFALKHHFRRERPEAALHLVEIRSPSFPSGHSMAASIFYLTTGALLTQAARRRREKIYLLWSALTLTALIGLSRIYLGVHYPTDVLAGWCAGFAWAILCWAVARWIRRNRRRLAARPDLVRSL